VPSGAIDQAYVEVLPELQRFVSELNRQLKQQSAAIAASVNKTVGQAFTSTGKQITRVGDQARGVGRSLTYGITLPLAALGTAAVKTFASFEEAMAHIVGLVGVPRAQVQAWEKDVRRLAVQFGKSGVEAAEALYFITSSGITGSKAIDTLNISLKASATGLGDTQVLANLLTSALNAYKSTGLSAARATDILTAAVAAGKLEPAELAGSMSEVLPIASQMGLSFEEVAAAQATMSLTGTSASESATRLRAILDALQKPSKQAVDILDKYGLSAAGLRKQLAGQGLVAVLQTLQGTVGRNTEDLNAFLGRIEASTGVTQLSANKFGDLNGILKQVTNSTGALDKGYAAVANTAQQRLNRSIASLKDSMIDLGRTLTPVVEDLGRGVARLTSWLSGLSEEQRKAAVYAGLLLAVLGPLNYVIGSIIVTVGRVVTAIGFLVTWIGKTVRGVMLLVNVMRFVAVALAIPVGLIGAIVVALAALGVGLVIAYKKSETFRNIVNGALNAVKNVALAVVRWFTDTALPAMKRAWDGIAAGALWLWQHAVVPAWNGIQAAVRVAWAIVRPIFTLWQSIMRLLGGVVTWLYKNVIAPYFRLIALAVQVAWVAIRIVFGSFQILLKIVASVVTWLWRNVFVPVFHAIGTIVRVWWNVVVRPIFNSFMATLRVVASVVSWFWRSVIVPVWNGIGKAISWAWSHVIKPVFSALGGFISRYVAPAFKAGVDAIGRAWNAVKNVAKAPVRFIIETVINAGIIDTYNRIRRFFFGKGDRGQIGHIALPKGFARGGVFDQPTAIVGEGGPHPEYVIPTDPRHRQRAVKLYQDLGAQLMQDGGIIGSLLSHVPGFGALEKAVDRVRELGSSTWVQPIIRLPRIIFNWVVDKIKSFITSGAGRLVGPGLEGVPQATGTNQNIVKSLAQSIYAWTGAQWSALYQLVMHESGFRNTAQNPISSAYGMFQFLDSTWATVNGFKTSDPRLQAIYGLAYIRQRYGDPLGAWSFWQRYHWYREGTSYVPKTGLYGLHKGEAVIPESLNRRSPIGPSTVTVHAPVTVNIAGDVGDKQVLEMKEVLHDFAYDLLRELRTGGRR